MQSIAKIVVAVVTPYTDKIFESILFNQDFKALSALKS